MLVAQQVAVVNDRDNSHTKNETEFRPFNFGNIPFSAELVMTSEIKPKQKYGAVIYTDGSVRPTNPGFLGWGAHGYIYEMKPAAKKVLIDDWLLTDNGYFKTTQPAAFAGEKAISVPLPQDILPVTPLKYIDGVGSNDTKGTNNAAEVQAIYHSLLFAQEMKLDQVNFFSDSQYAIQGVTQGCAVWAKYNWLNRDGLEIPNALLWKKTYDLLTSLRAQGVVVNIDKVKAHVGFYGNEQADTLAMVGMNYSSYQQSRSGFVTSDPKNYWDIHKHPFITYKNIYFNSVSQFNQPGHYYQAESGAGEYLLGKRLAQSGFSVIRLTEHDPVIEAVKQKQYDIANDINAICKMNLDKVHNKHVYRYLREYGKFCLSKNKSSLGVTFREDKMAITTEVNPTGLSLRAIESLNFLETLLNSFLELHRDETKRYSTIEKLNWHDVTDIFYQTETKIVKGQEQVKQLLRKEIDNNLENFKLEITEQHNEQPRPISIPIILGLDLLPRNNLKRLEEHQPRIHLITWRESITTLRYATVVQCATGVGIWSNYFADKILLD